MIRRARRLALLGTLAAAVAVAGIALPANAADVDANAGGYTVYVPGVDANTSTVGSSFLVSPNCGTGAKADTPLKNWDRKPGTSSVAHLRCGTQATFGLRHINKGHGQDWENVRAKYAQPGTWDSFMETITAENLISPSTKITPADNKDTYHGYLCVRQNDDGEVVRAYDTIIPVGQGNDNIITSYFLNGRASDPHC